MGRHSGQSRRVRAVPVTLPLLTAQTVPWDLCPPPAPGGEDAQELGTSLGCRPCKPAMRICHIPVLYDPSRGACIADPLPSREASGFLPRQPPHIHTHVPSPISGRRDFHEDTVESQRMWLMSPAVPRGLRKDRGGGPPLRGICGCMEGPGDRERGELLHVGQGRASPPGEELPVF